MHYYRYRHSDWIKAMPDVTVAILGKFHPHIKTVPGRKVLIA